MTYQLTIENAEDNFTRILVFFHNGKYAQIENIFECPENQIRKYVEKFQKEYVGLELLERDVKLFEKTGSKSRSLSSKALAIALSLKGE